MILNKNFRTSKSGGAVRIRKPAAVSVNPVDYCRGQTGQRNFCTGYGVHCQCIENRTYAFQKK
jgi:hypothetical protein